MNSSRVKLQHRPFLTPIWLTAGAAAAAFVFALFVIWMWGSADSTTIIVVSEAEQAEGRADALSPTGNERAQRLADMFGTVRVPGSTGRAPGVIDAIYVSDSPRSRLTAAPLARSLRLPLSVTGGSDGRTMARGALREHRGGRLLIVARFDAMGGVLTALSGIEDVPMAEAQNDAVIYVVTVPRIGHANLLRFNY